MALLTTPYDPRAGQAAVGGIIELAAKLEQSRAIAEKQRVEQFAADQRRSFEIERKLEFERARTAADDARADDRLAWEKTVWGADNAPIPTLGGGGGEGAPSYSVPSIPTGASGGGERTPARTSGGIQASGGEIPDLTSAEIPEVGNAAEDTGEPEAATVSPAAALGDISDDSSDLPAGGGVPVLAPIMATDIPTNPKGGAPAPVMPPSTGEILAKNVRDLQAAGIPVRPKDLRSGVTAALAAAGRQTTARGPVVRDFKDGTTRQYNAVTGEWNILASGPKGMDLEEATKGMEFNADHGTYKNADGAEFFVGLTNGKPSLRPYKPATERAAKLLWGSDGKVYPHDSQGNPLKPIPEGVELRQQSRMQTQHVEGEGTYMVHPDGSKTMLIPEGVLPTAKQKEAYREEVELAAVSKDDAAKEKELLRNKPTGIAGWFGASESSVAKKEELAKKSEEAVKRWHEQFPQLKPKKALDPATAKSYLEKAAGDKAKARELAKADGYSL